MRIKADDTTAHPIGTVLNDHEGSRTVVAEYVQLSKTGAPYRIDSVTFTATGRTELQMIGPRASVYLLHQLNAPGVLRPVSLNTGAPLRRKGNEVLLIGLGGVFEPTTPAAVAATARH